MSATLPKLLTAEEFFCSPANQKRTELVRGEVRTNMPPGGLHGSIAGNIYFALRLWRDAHSPGDFVGVESGYLLQRRPDTVRSPDVSLVSAKRVPPNGIPTNFWPFAPDLAVEVVSPDQIAAELQEKVTEYLDAGTREVWVVYPGVKEVHVHRPDGAARRFSREETLTSTLLTRFDAPVAAFFV